MKNNGTSYIIFKPHQLIFGGEFRTDVSFDHTDHCYSLVLYIVYETGGVRICSKIEQRKNTHHILANNHQYVKFISRMVLLWSCFPLRLSSYLGNTTQKNTQLMLHTPCSLCMQQIYPKKVAWVVYLNKKGAERCYMVLNSLVNLSWDIILVECHHLFGLIKFTLYQQIYTYLKYLIYFEHFDY